MIYNFFTHAHHRRKAPKPISGDAIMPVGDSDANITGDKREYISPQEHQRLIEAQKNDRATIEALSKTVNDLHGHVQRLGGTMPPVPPPTLEA
jgi:hypothetical protein